MAAAKFGMEHVSLWEVILYRHILDVAPPSGEARTRKVA